MDAYDIAVIVVLALCVAYTSGKLVTVARNGAKRKRAGVDALNLEAFTREELEEATYALTEELQTLQAKYDGLRGMWRDAQRKAD